MVSAQVSNSFLAVVPMSFVETGAWWNMWNLFAFRWWDQGHDDIMLIDRENSLDCDSLYDGCCSDKS